MYLERISRTYPDFTPRNDFEILAIGAGDYKGPATGIYTWLDQEFSARVEASGSARRILDVATRIMSRNGPVTGVRGLSYTECSITADAVS